MMARLRSTAVGALVAALALALPAVAGTPTTAADTVHADGPSHGAPLDQCSPGIPTGPTGAAFYDPPAPLPTGQHGDLIWANSVPAPDHARACRILYLSTLHDGTKIAVSGVAVWPDRPAPDGGRNVLAWAHGTVGGPRQCAPSAAADPAVNLNDYFSFQSDLGIDVGVPALTDFLDAGDAVVATDYQGLGTPGVHQYVVADTETNNTLDSVLALRQIQGAHAGRQTAVLGWSQGGGAALFIGQNGPAYAPTVQLVGVAALAPAADIGPELEGDVRPGPRTATSRAHNAALRINVYRGFLAAYPELKAAQVLQPAGIQALAGDGVACIEHFADVLESNYAEMHKLNTLFQPLKDVPQTWRNRFDQNTPGYATTVTPVLVMQGTDDSVINPYSTAQYIQRACKFTQPIEYTTYKGATHNTVPFVARKEYLAWIAARFAGVKAPSNC